MAPKRNALILASASPRRRLILRRAGYRFRIVPSHVAERVASGVSPSKRVELLAFKKARSIARKYPDAVVLGADTLVFINGHAVGKPVGLKHARRMLAELSGRWQSVITGVAVVWSGGRRKILGSATSLVKFRKLDRRDIDKAAHKHHDKAGAYAVQEKKDGFVEKITGDYDNVVGLPLKVVKRLLRRLPEALAKRV